MRAGNHYHFVNRREPSCRQYRCMLNCITLTLDVMRAGLAGCGVDTTTAPIGTVFTVPFVVFDRSTPAARATLNRTVTVVNPCAQSQTYCAGGAPECGDSPCALRAALALEDEPPAVSPPAIAVPLNTAGSARVRYTIDGVQVSTICGSQPPFNLQVCGTQKYPRVGDGCNLTAVADKRSAALPRSLASLPSDACGAGAQNGSQCVLCAPAATQQAQCAASRQRWEYRIVDAAGVVTAPYMVDVTIGDLLASASIRVQLVLDAAPAGTAAAGLPQNVSDWLEQGITSAAGQQASCALLGESAGIVEVSALLATRRSSNAGWILNGTIRFALPPGGIVASGGATCLQDALAALPSANLQLGTEPDLRIDSVDSNVTAATCEAPDGLKLRQLWVETTMQDTSASLTLTATELVCPGLEQAIVGRAYAVHSLMRSLELMSHRLGISLS